MKEAEGLYMELLACEPLCGLAATKNAVWNSQAQALQPECQGLRESKCNNLANLGNCLDVSQTPWWIHKGCSDTKAFFLKITGNKAGCGGACL